MLSCSLKNLFNCQKGAPGAFLLALYLKEVVHQLSTLYLMSSFYNPDGIFCISPYARLKYVEQNWQ